MAQDDRRRRISLDPEYLPWNPDHFEIKIGTFKVADCGGKKPRPECSRRQLESGMDMSQQRHKIQEFSS
jgi:hypothetical protein